MHHFAALSAIFTLASALTTSHENLRHTTGGMTDMEYSKFFDYLTGLHADGSAYASTHHGHSFFEMFKTTYSCPEMRRYPPGTQDGGKYACNMDALTKPCVIYSIGSEGNYLFEEEMLPFGCEIHTFDCFGDYGRNAPAGVTFHKWCIAGRNEGQFRTLESIMDELGHTRVDYLKMDVEGAEYYAVPHLLDLPKERLPVQFGLEIHPFSFWWHNEQRSQSTTRATTQLMIDFHRLGYRLVSREDNILARCCSEFLYVLPDELPQTTATTAAATTTPPKEK